MSITVNDCLKLPSLTQAHVVAGRGGLTKNVSSITVLEYADADLISPDLFINNEICITAFTSIKDDIDAQCTVLRRLREVGIVAVVLYYVGVFIPHLDERLVDIAEEIDLPLICMPYNRIDFRYSELINDVMNAIYLDQRKNSSFVPAMLESISSLPEQRRTVGTILRLISDRLHCSFVLTDERVVLKAEALWPMASQWDYLPLLELCRSDAASFGLFRQYLMNIGQKRMYISHAAISTGKIPTMHLLAMDEMGALTSAQMEQAAELVTLFLKLWDSSFEETNPTMLVKAILNNEPIRMHQIARQHNIDIGKIDTMWVLHEDPNLDANACKQRAIMHMEQAKQFMHKQQKWVLMDQYKKSVVIFLQSPAYTELDENLMPEFVNALSEPERGIVLVRFTGLTSAKDARDAYELMERCYPELRVVYPHKNVFSSYDVHFVDQCIRVIKSGEPVISEYLYPLQPLTQLNSASTLVDTLAVYLLDAERNMQETGALMYLHKNTIKYRLNRIRQYVNSDLFQMPFASAIYQAVALRRILGQNHPK